MAVCTCVGEREKPRAHGAFYHLNNKMRQITESSTLLQEALDVEASEASSNAISLKRLAIGAIAVVAAVAGVGAVVHQQQGGPASTPAELTAQRQPDSDGIIVGDYHGKDDDYYFTRNGVTYERVDSKSDDAYSEYMTFVSEQGSCSAEPSRAEPGRAAPRCDMI